MTGRSVHGAVYRVFWPCRDGYLNFILYGGVAGRRTNEGLIAWMGEAGADLGALAGRDLTDFDPTQASQDEVDAIEAPIAAFFATLSKREFLDGACAREMMGYPVSDASDISADPQLEARGFWVDLPGPDGAAQRHAGGFALVDGVRLPLRRAEPALGAADQAPASVLGLGEAERAALVAAGVLEPS
jgi:crotonobetainyl-CoA:carnitine CoA-transferase CaiB-like acyl-CoA transferase